MTSDVFLSAWEFKHLNKSIEGHDASTRTWDANKPLTCLLIIACVVVDLFAKKKSLHQSESNIHHRNEVVVEKMHARRTTSYHRHKTQKANIDLPILTCKTESMSKLRRVLC